MATSIDKMTVKQLKDELRDLGEKVSGRKAELQDRLKKARKGKTPASSPRKKSIAKTPEEKASELSVGEERTGRDGIQYEVFETKAGLRWRKCSATTATCTLAATSTSLEKELSKMTNKQLLEKISEDELKQLKADVRKTRKASPKKSDYVAFLLTKEAEKRPTPPPSPPRKRKGKERAVPKPKPTAKEGIELGGYTVIGALEEAFNFMKSLSKTSLMNQIDEIQGDPTLKEKVRGIMRLESNADCKRNCGAQVVIVNMEQNEYPIETKLKSGYLEELKIGAPKVSGSTRADISFIQNLLVADVDAIYDFIRDINTFDELLSKPSPLSNIKIFKSSKSRKTPYLMNIKLPGKEGEFRGIYIKRAD